MIETTYTRTCMCVVALALGCFISVMYVYPADLGFNQSEYVVRESEVIHTIPVVVTNGRLPVDTVVQVRSELATAGEKFYCT